MTDSRPPTLAPTTSVPLVESVVDLSVIAANLTLVREIARTPVMAVVKADAFGHGASEVARTVLGAGVRWLGVATIDEALALRREGIAAPILAWLVDPSSAIDHAVNADVTLSCADSATLTAVADAARRNARRAKVHLELDTGMNRGGASPTQWAALFPMARALDDRGWIDVEGIWSHLACASDPRREGIARQHEAFVAGVTAARQAGITPRLLHLANSAAALAHPECRFSMVRVGAALYGIETVDGQKFGLRSAVRLTSRVVHVRRVAAGAAVGYSAAWRAQRDTTLALVPAGYADGVPRSLSGSGSVSIDGRRHPIVGSISMDQLVVDVGDAGISVGDEVVLLGETGSSEPDPREWAELTGTVAHEILTGIGPRVARRHVLSC